MKIAVLADIHGNHIALETCIHEAKKHGAEEYLFLGDYLGELAYPEKTMSFCTISHNCFDNSPRSAGSYPQLPGALRSTL